MANSEIRFYEVNPMDGPTGPGGPTGPQGPTGQKGDQGVTGLQGERGSSGPAGEQGIGGLQGEQGIAGRRGTPGRHGAQGPVGQNGDKLHLAWSCGPSGGCGFNQDGTSYSNGGEFGYPGGCTGAPADDCTPATAYIGVVVTATQILPRNFLINPESYTWFPFIGVQGNKGDQSTVAGPSGSSQYFHIAWNTTGNCTGNNFSTNSFTNATHMGTYVDYNAYDSESCNYYDWVEVEGPAGDKGSEGPPGPAGNKGQKGPGGAGPAGAKGSQGEATYLHIKYADIINPQNQDCDEQSTREYIGTYSDNVEQDDNNCSAYAWSQWTGTEGDKGAVGPGGSGGTEGPQGPQGPTGVQGTQGATFFGGPVGPQGVTGAQGETGATGLETSVHFKYSFYANGFECNSDPYYSGGTGMPYSYIGVFSGIEEPNDNGSTGGSACFAYTWSNYQGGVGSQGPAGAKGQDGLEGNAGPKGPGGPGGSKGSVGPGGPAGPGGSKGYAGPAGLKGQKGLKGEYGSKGPAGNQGPGGPKGLKGQKGFFGATGAGGDKGAGTFIHLNYSNSSDGSNCNQSSGDYIGILVDSTETDSSNCGWYDWYQLTGDPGGQGMPGPGGNKGQKGKKGTPGDDGSDGSKGEVGSQGATQYGGPTGPQGTPGPSGPADIDIINKYCDPADPNCEWTIRADGSEQDEDTQVMFCGGGNATNGKSVIAAYLSIVEVQGAPSHTGEMGCKSLILGDGSTGAAACIVDQGSLGTFRCGCGIICQ